MVSPLASGRFLFLRHGRTAANAADLVCGATDLPLDAMGRAQAARAAERLRDDPPGAIWTSALSRARATAEAVAATTGLRPRLHAGLGERDWGAWEGGPRAALVRDAVPPGGEGPAAFRDRVLAALEAIDGPPPILIVAHSGTARVIHARLLATPFARLANGELVEWRRDRTGWTCHTIVKDGC